jgi:plasmid stabilization system protein ParE
MAWTVLLSDTAEADLLAIYQFIAERAGPTVAIRSSKELKPIVAALTRHLSEARGGMTCAPDCGRLDIDDGQRYFSRLIDSHDMSSFTASTMAGAVWKAPLMTV